jgi:thiazolylpeptide-type bacteriocin precursor
MNNSVKTGPVLTALATELRSLEAGTFEIHDYAGADDLMAAGACSIGSCISCIGCTSG